MNILGQTYYTADISFDAKRKSLQSVPIWHDRPFCSTSSGPPPLNTICLVLSCVQRVSPDRGIRTRLRSVHITGRRAAGKTATVDYKSISESSEFILP